MVRRAFLAFCEFYIYFLTNATSLETVWRIFQLKLKKKTPQSIIKKKENHKWSWFLDLVSFLIMED